MAVYTQNNKILLNNAGEAYKTAPIIDISSSYGVTKDGSNLVSAVKNRYYPNKFRQTVGANQPIENGDGFAFNNTDTLRSHFGAIPDLVTSPYCIEFWGKITATSANYHTFYQYGNAPGTNELFMRYFDNSGLRINPGSAELQIPLVTLSLNTYYHFFINLRTHVNMVDQHYLGVFINGVLKFKILSRQYLEHNIVKSEMVLGNFGRGITTPDRSLKGNIAAFCMVLESMINIDNFTVGQQVFTPPTYPNTIL